MRSRARCLLVLAAGCTGDIEGIEPIAETPAASVPGPGGQAGAGGPRGASPPAPPPAPGTYGFDCADGAAGEGRPLRRLSREEIRRHLLNVFSGTSLGSGAAAKVDFALTPVPDDAGDAKHFAEELLELTEGHLQAYTSAAESLGTIVAALPAADHDLLSGARCKTPATALDACARGIADELGLRLFRRPPTDAEVAKLRDYLAASGATAPAQALAAAFSYLLLLPPSLLHLEDGGELVRAGQGVRITGFESLNRIYFGLLGTSPPIAILKAARAPDWTRAKAEQRIEEILASPAFRARVLAFFQEWLGYGPVVDLSALPTRMTSGLVPKEIPSEAYEELRAFVAAKVFDSRGTVSDLLLSGDVHYLGPNLARIYGLPVPAAKGPLAAKVVLDPQRHGGLLSRVAMNLHVEPMTSPIGRGVRVKRKLYCEDVEPPPDLNVPGAEIVEIADPSKVSNRALVENKTSPPLCQGCHVSINRIGFQLDFYDSLGRYRTEEIRYDVKGNVAGTFPLATDVGGPLALTRQVVETERGSACFVGQWRSFTAQEDKHSGQSCLKRELHGAVRTGGAGMLEMMRQSARAELDAVKDLGRNP